MILHFAVAVSIVLIGIKVLIGFGQSTYDGARVVKDELSYQFYKFEDKWQDSKEKKKFVKSMKKTIESATKFARYRCHENSKFHLTLEEEKICIEQTLNDWSNFEAIWYRDAKQGLLDLQLTGKINWPNL